MCLVRRDIFNARPEVDKCSTRHSVYKETIMILDALENADAYNALNSGFAKAFEFLRRDDLAELEEGRHDIDGERVYAMIVKAAGREREVGELEAHLAAGNAEVLMPFPISRKFMRCRSF